MSPRSFIPINSNSANIAASTQQQQRRRSPQDQENEGQAPSWISSDGVANEMQPDRGDQFSFYASASSEAVVGQLSHQLQLQQQQQYYSQQCYRQSTSQPQPLPQPPMYQQQLPPPPLPPIHPRPGSALSFLSTDSDNAADDVQLARPDGDLGQPTSPQLSFQMQVPNSLSFPSADDNNAEDKSNPRFLNIKNWIIAAVKSLDNEEDNEGNNKSKKLSSGPYLSCALKIAHLLTEQLCKFQQEENGNQGGEDTTHEHTHESSLGLTWSNIITIGLNHKSEEGDIDPYKSDDKEHESCEPCKDLDAEEIENRAQVDELHASFHPDWSAHEQGGETQERAEINGDVFEGRFHPVKDAPSRVYGSKSIQKGEAKKASDMVSGLLPEVFKGRQGGRQDSKAPLNNFPLPGVESFHQEGAHHEGSPPIVDYLNISSAKFQVKEFHAQEGPSGQGDKTRQIYYLGLVLFELFSGGKIPITEDDHDHPPDFSHAMTILGALGKDDELFGGMDMSLDESGRSMDDGFKSNKKNMRVAEDSAISVEPLRSLGLPNALCDLIGNMLACSRGDFSNDETYSCVEDVRKDLKLMLEQPGVYLRNVDLDLACRVGLRMDDNTATQYGRDAEFTSLQEAYLRSMTDLCGVAIVCGQQGVGKSSLAQEFAQYAKRGDGKMTKGCIYLSGNFDKLKQSQPFSVIASAFNAYCEWLSLSDERTSIAEMVSSALKLALGQEVDALTKVIPNLSNMIRVEPDANESDGVEDAQKRLRYLLSQFAEVIALSHDAPLVLFLDNLQWADSASIALLKQILLTFASSNGDKNRQFFFIGCCNEMEKNNDLWDMLNSVRDFGVNTTKIELDFLEKETVNLMISKKLNMLPRLTRSLTHIVYHKTKGNPFFVSQLLVELSKEGLLRPSLSLCRWEWDEEKIQERELPDDVVSFLTASLERLPSDVLSALCTLSCFGSCSERSLVGLNKELGLSLSDSLDHAIAEGFLIKKKGQYHFVDDRVKESAYSLMKPEERCLQHSKYGLALCTVAERNDDDGLFLIAVGQINLGGPNAVTDDKERIAVANHNLTAGKKAMSMSDFFSAYWFHDYGISYLKKGHWQAHYDLTLALYDGAAECALIVGEHASLSIITEQVMHFAKSIEDKLHIFHISVRILIYRSNLAAAIECATDVLSNLGEDLPKEITPDVVVHFVEETKEMLEGMTDEELINHKIMSNPKKIASMKFLARLSETLYMARPGDQPVVVLKMVQLSLEHGMGPLSPLAFVSYGSFLASMGNISEGYRYARIAKALLETVGSRRVAGEVIAYSTQLMAYAEPVQSAIESHIEGEKAANESGSTPFAILNAFLFCSCSYWSGKKLLSVKSQLDRTMSLAKQNNHMVMMVQLMPLSGSVTKMVGLSDNPESNVGSDLAFDMERLGLRVKNPFQTKPHYFNKMYTAFIFRNYSDMKSAAEQYSKCKVGAWIFVFSSSIQLFYEGLISFWIGRNEEDLRWITKGINSCRAIESLADSTSNWNFENKALLLQAEEKYCSGNLDIAETLYDRAVLSSRQHHFLNEEALSLELAGLFYLKTGRTDRSITYFNQAIEKYHEWEACAKAVTLKKHLQEFISES